MSVVVNDRSREVLAKIRRLTNVNLKEFTETAIEVAKQEVARDTGNLSDSIANDNPEPGIFRVFTEVGYGGYVELGTARMSPRPYIAPGIDVAVREFEQNGNWA